MVRVRPRDKLEALLQGKPQLFFSYGAGRTGSAPWESGSAPRRWR